MILVKITGGLGNQLFQVAYALELSKRTKQKIYLDLDAYKTYKLRSFSLDNFHVKNQYEIAPNLGGIKFLNYKLLSRFYRVYQKIIKILNVTDRYGKHFFYKFEKYGYHFNFDPFYYDSNTLNKRYFIYGYFQSEKYFKNCRGEISSLFKVAKAMTHDEQLIYDKIDSGESVAISLRLGSDYLKCKELNVCDKMFYINAIKKIISLIDDNPTFFVFSDDVNQAVFLDKEFPELEFNYIENMNDYQSLRLMYNCKHFVIANSSFSWWGAYLSENNKKIIIAPDKWYNHISSSGDIYTSDMKKIGDI